MFHVTSWSANASTKFSARATLSWKEIPPNGYEPGRASSSLGNILLKVKTQKAQAKQDESRWFTSWLKPGLETEPPCEWFTGTSPSTRMNVAESLRCFRKIPSFVLQLSWNKPNWSNHIDITLNKPANWWVRHINSSEQHLWLRSKEGLCLQLRAAGLCGTWVYDEGLGYMVAWWAVVRVGTGRATSCILCKCLSSQPSLKTNAYGTEIPPIRVTREDFHCIFIISLALQLHRGDGSRGEKHGCSQSRSMSGWGPCSATALPVLATPGQVASTGLWLFSCSIFALIETKL